MPTAFFSSKDSKNSWVSSVFACLDPEIGNFAAETGVCLDSHAETAGHMAQNTAAERSGFSFDAIHGKPEFLPIAFEGHSMPFARLQSLGKGCLQGASFGGKIVLIGKTGCLQFPIQNLQGNAVGPGTEDCLPLGEMLRYPDFHRHPEPGICGEITSVNFEWLLDTSHGADYFRRWHRCKRNSGGLMVHKATHHFDLVNWWLDSVPETVYAMGDLKFYGRENAEKRGVTEFYQRAKGSEIAKKDPFAFRLDKDFTEFLQRLYFDSEKYDGYQRDQSVFGDGIDIEDNMGVMVRYKNNVVMNYTLCAHCPYEGYRICFNGTKGRLEFYVIERGVTQLDEDFSTFGNREDAETEGQDLDRKKMAPEILFQPFWGKPVVYTYDNSIKSGHGGGDIRLMNNLFIGVKDDPLGHAADFTDGAMSILTGIGANISMRTGEPVKVQELIHF